MQIILWSITSCLKHLCVKAILVCYIFHRQIHLFLDKIQWILKLNLTRTCIFHTFNLRLENQIRLSHITLHVKWKITPKTLETDTFKKIIFCDLVCNFTKTLHPNGLQVIDWTTICGLDMLNHPSPDLQHCPWKLSCTSHIPVYFASLLPYIKKNQIDIN